MAIRSRAQPNGISVRSSTPGARSTGASGMGPLTPFDAAQLGTRRPAARSATGAPSCAHGCAAAAALLDPDRALGRGGVDGKGVVPGVVGCTS